MRARPLGKTGFVVSSLGLGTWGLSGEAYGAVSEDVADAVVRRALDIGITLFDTCDAYGGGRMEALLGRTVPSRDAVIVTRVGTDRTTDPPRKRFEADFLRDRVRASAKRLRRDALDVVLLHHPSADTLNAGVATAALDDLKREGLCRSWGVSVADVEAGRAAVRNGAQVIELAYNLFHSADLHRLAGEVMVGGVGVLACSVLHYGLLAGLWPREQEFAEGDHRRSRWTRVELERRIEQLAAVRFLVKGDVLTLRAAAVRFVLANQLIASAILGPRSVEQLEQLVRETGAGPRFLPDDDLNALPVTLDRVGIVS